MDRSLDAVDGVCIGAAIFCGALLMGVIYDAEGVLSCVFQLLG